MGRWMGTWLAADGSLTTSATIPVATTVTVPRTRRGREQRGLRARQRPEYGRDLAARSGRGFQTNPRPFAGCAYPPKQVIKSLIAGSQTPFAANAKMSSRTNPLAGRPARHLLYAEKNDSHGARNGSSTSSHACGP
jgi:hypothetical protein